MIKSLSAMLKRDRERFKIPRSVQDVVPIRHCWPDGIFQVGNKFSKTIRFSDINYAVAGKEDKKSIFRSYAEFLNSLDSSATTKITINNKRIDRAGFRNSTSIPHKDDALDCYRDEVNGVMFSKMLETTDGIEQERYITISIHKKSVEEARVFFARVMGDAKSQLSRMGSKTEELSSEQRLKILHDFYRDGEMQGYPFSLHDTMKRGHSVKDYICPDSLEFRKDHFVMGKKYGRVLYLRDYASYIKDDIVKELTELNRSLMMSIDVVPVPTDEAVREVQKILLGIETDIANHQRRQNTNGNFAADVPHNLALRRAEAKELLDDLTTRDQRLNFAVITLVHLADSKKELDSDTEAIQAAAQQRLCTMSTLHWQQMDGLNTVLPLGVRKIDALRTLTTESLSVFMPFTAQELRDKDGVWYGQNAISKNLILVDRHSLLNGNGFITGSSGSGKSMMAKLEMIMNALKTMAEIVIIDPDGEYAPLVRALGGEVITISASSLNHINALDMEQGYGDGENPVILKAEFILSMFEQLVAPAKLSAKEKSIIDRCTALVYKDYVRGNCIGTPPTLQDFYRILLQQTEPEARDVALIMELFTTGSLNTFAKVTNVNTNSRIVCYDIRDLGKQLLPVGMLVVLDSIFNRVIRNRALGKKTWIYIDEIYLLFQHEYSANFLFTLWKRVRKYGACATGITQNLEDLLQSHTARTMLGNSEFLVMLNQAPKDREALAKLLNISDNQMTHITDVPAGHGLLKCGSAIVPFVNEFPKDTQLYKLMTTKPEEVNQWS